MRPPHLALPYPMEVRGSNRRPVSMNKSGHQGDDLERRVWSPVLGVVHLLGVRRQELKWLSASSGRSGRATATCHVALQAWYTYQLPSRVAQGAC
jgi:hypothetical protein